MKGPRSLLFEAVETGMGAHEHPLSIIISTQAPTDADLLSVLIDSALTGDDPRTTCSLYTTPLDDDPFLVKNIKKANPAYGDFLNAEEVKRNAQDAKRMPAREPSYRNLVLNQRVESKSLFVSPSVWQQNAGEVLPFGQAKVYGGLDLSATNDLTALVLVAEIDNAWHVESRFWLPSEGLREKSHADRVPYDQWAKEGYLQTTPGNAIEYTYIAHELRRLFDTLNIVKIAFDRWNWKFLKPVLSNDAGFSEYELDKFDPFGQGYQSMSPALRQLETVLLDSRLRHDDNPVLRMCAANAVVQTDPAGNRKLAKDKSAGRIDGMVALAMAIGVTDTESPAYVTGRLRTI